MAELFSKRELGVLLHPSSFPTNEPVGTLGKSAYAFLDWLESTGATLWQILPLCPNGKYDSPYFSPSSFCGNPWLIDLEDLATAGLVNRADLPTEENDNQVDYPKLRSWKEPLLMKAAKAFANNSKHAWQSNFARFCETHTWLEETALYYVAKGMNNSQPWWEWPKEARNANASFLAEIRKSKTEEVKLRKILFFFFERQWEAVHAYARKKGIRIVGDLPIYVDEDSAEVWLNQEGFKIDENGHREVVSGVPPDYFSETGQYWGNPIYKWDVMEATGFSWWKARLHRLLELSDIVRIDHFRGLSAYWEIPGDATDARKGTWVKGPGQKFFDEIKKEFPEMPFIAEDLGLLDDDVYTLRDNNELLGMRIAQFGFVDDPDGFHQPHNYPERSLAYTGTHDNCPTAGWFTTLPVEKQQGLADYLKVSLNEGPERVVRALVESVIACKSKVAVVPVQDLLALGEHARMNDPSKFDGNWSWRMPSNSLTPELARSIAELQKKYRP